MQNSLKKYAIAVLLASYPWQVADSADAAAYHDYAEVSRVEGVYIRGFEVNVLIPDGGKEPWWVITDADEFYAKMAPLLPDKGDKMLSPHALAQRFRLVASGRLSGPGQYGHLDRYRREIYINRIIEISRIEE